MSVSDLDVYVESRKVFRQSEKYLLGMALRRLKTAGIRTRILERFDPRKTGGTAFLHVDLTTLPAPFSFIDRFYPRCINGRATTISRDLYSTAILRRDDEHTGPVVVKTLLNHRGLSELRFAAARGFLSHQREIRRTLCPFYEVLDSVEQVPDEVWSNPHLVVERFVPGTLDLPTVKWRQEFFLDLELNTRQAFSSNLCEPAALEKLEFLRDAPPEVRAVRRRMNLDFGSIDYFIVDDEVSVIDCNKTPSFTPDWVARMPELTRYVADVTDRLIVWVREAR